MKNIADYLCEGIENPISRKRLEATTGYCDRVNRESLEVIRPDVPIVNLQDGNGYFIATEDDADLQAALRQYNREFGRAMKILRGQKAVKRLLHTHGQLKFDDLDEALARRGI